MYLTVAGNCQFLQGGQLPGSEFLANSSLRYLSVLCGKKDATLLELQGRDPPK